MFSKTAWKIGSFVIFGIALLLSTGCGEKPPTAVPPDSGLGEQAKCLNKLVPDFESFFEGSARVQQVQATWDCLGSVVSLFEQKIHGRFEDRFTSQELANFVKQNFLENKKVNESTMIEVFRVKQLLVGGANDSISREEIGRLVVVIGQLKGIAVGLNPYMKVLSFHWSINGAAALESDLKYFEGANQQIQMAAKDLATLIEKNGQAYKIDYFISLMKEMSQYASSEWTWLKGLESAMPLVRKLKQTLTDGDQTNILPSEWRRFALLGGRGYIQYLRYFYFIKSVNHIGNGPELVFITASIDDLFSFLGDMVDGKSGKVLTRQELLEILQSLAQFIPNFKISDSFLVETLKIKNLFFGGNIEKFEKADFERARGKLADYRAMAEKFLVYASVYGLSWNGNESASDEALKYFQAAESNLIELATHLGKNMEGQYDLADLMRLGKEFELLYPHSQSLEKKETQKKEAEKKVPDNKDLEKLTLKWVPVLISIKNMIFTDQDSVVGKSMALSSQPRIREIRQQWSDFLMVSAQFYSRFAHYHYFLKNKEILHGKGLQNLEVFEKASIPVLKSLVSRKPANPVSQISFAEWNRLWLALKGAGVLPEKITIETLNSLTKVVMQKLLLDPKSRIAKQFPDGLTVQGVEQLHSEISIWLENQKFLEAIYLGTPPDAGKMGAIILGDLNRATATVGLEELKLIYNTPVALSFDLQGRLELKQPAAPYLQETSDLINVIRSLARMVIRSYSMTEQGSESLTGGLNLEEAKIFFNDLRTPLNELGILDPKNDKFMINRFREANLFTPRANGNEYLDFKEGVDLGMMLVSGLKIDSMFYEKLERTCTVSKPSGFKYDWTLNLVCVQNLYKQEIPEKYSSMPDFLKFLSTLSPERFQELFLNLLKAAGYKPVADGSIKVADLALFPQATQYVEMAFQKFDINRDTYLTTSEVMTAYPTFKEILREAANGKLKSDKNLKGLLTWLIKYEKPPGNIVDYIKFFTWWVPKGEQGWDIQADREKFVKILGFMADAVGSKSVPDPRVIPDRQPADDGLGNMSDNESLKDIEELKNIFCAPRSPQYNRRRCTQLQ